MRRIKMEADKLQEILQSTLAELVRGKTKITLDANSLLKIKAPKDMVKPTIVVPDTTRKQMKALVDVSSKELAWHCPVDYDPDSVTFTLGEVIMYPQNVTAATVESDDDLYTPWLEELEDDVFNKIRFQGHSHVSMGVSPSGTDTDFYELLTRHIKDYYIFFILNKHGKYWIELHDIANNLIYESADLEVIFERTGPNYTEWAEEQIDNMIVDKPKIVYPKHQDIVNSYKLGADAYTGGRY